MILRLVSRYVWARALVKMIKGQRAYIINCTYALINKKNNIAVADQGTKRVWAAKTPRVGKKAKG